MSYFDEDFHNRKFLGADVAQYQVNQSEFRKSGSDRSPSQGGFEFTFP